MHVKLQSGAQVSTIVPAPPPSARWTERRDSPMAIRVLENQIGSLIGKAERFRISREGEFEGVGWGMGVGNFPILLYSPD